MSELIHIIHMSELLKSELATHCNTLQHTVLYTLQHTVLYFDMSELTFENMVIYSTTPP